MGFKVKDTVKYVKRRRTITVNLDQDLINPFWDLAIKENIPGSKLATEMIRYCLNNQEKPQAEAETGE